MKKIFILGGSQLQLDLILEAKKMFFYTIVLDMDQNCIGSKWCDEFLHINILDKDLVLEKAKQHDIDLILTSATELGNITVCYVGEKLGLNTNSYQTSLNTTDKTLMKNILNEHNIKTASYKIVKNYSDLKWDTFPCIVKPSDSSAGRGLSYCYSSGELRKAYSKALKYSHSGAILIEEYIDGTQYSVETISCNNYHQIIAINREYINGLPHIMEVSHKIPANINSNLEIRINNLAKIVLNAFNIQYGAGHIELRINTKNEIYIVELGSRTGGMRTEMINLAYGISYSQLLILSSLNILTTLQLSRLTSVKCKFIISYEAYAEYLKIKQENRCFIFEPFEISNVEKGFLAEDIGQSKGYYFLLEKLDEDFD